MNLADLMERFATVEKAREYLEQQRWPDGPVCPHCGLCGEAYKITPKPRVIETEYISKAELKTKRARKPRKGLFRHRTAPADLQVRIPAIPEPAPMVRISAPVVGL